MTDKNEIYTLPNGTVVEISKAVSVPLSVLLGWDHSRQLRGIMPIPMVITEIDYENKTITLDTDVSPKK